MSVGLLDVNVLIALAWPSHVHHSDAHSWFSQHASGGWATCPMTQLGFVRVSSNPKIIPEAITPQEALRVVARFVSHRHHVFWTDELAVIDEVFPASLLVGHQQVTDAYLLALAIHKGGTVVTLDRGISSLLPPSSPHRRAIEVIPVGR